MKSCPECKGAKNVPQRQEKEHTQLPIKACPTCGGSGQVPESLLEKLGITPGPWYASEVLNFSGTLVSYIQKDGITLFQTRHQDSEYTETQCKADAELAAIAPVMFHALRKVADLLSYLQTDDGEGKQKIMNVIELAVAIATDRDWAELQKLDKGE